MVGKDLAHMDGVAVRLDDLDLATADVTAAADRPPTEIFVDQAALLVNLPSGWWGLSRDGSPLRRPEIAAAIALPGVDVPGLGTVSGESIFFCIGRRQWYLGQRTTGSGAGTSNGGSTDVLLGAGALAWRCGPRRWAVHDLPRPRGDVPSMAEAAGSIGVLDGVNVLGLARLDGLPALVLLGRAGLLVSVVSPVRTKTLTRWSGSTQPPLLHAHRPLIAVRRPDGALEVGDLATGLVLLRRRPGS